jgi:uncharacterized metal-binding protein YceD (DUF177 family)
MAHKHRDTIQGPGARPEFSRPFKVGELGAHGRTISLTANADERNHLARRFDLEAIHSLTADLDVTPLDGELWHVKGSFRADVVQTCVVSLEPVPALVEERLEAIFAPDGEPEPGDRSVVVSFDEVDPPEPIRDGCLDLGELVAERLALALDPYPRATGAELPQDDAGDQPVDNPFQALGRLLDGGKSGKKQPPE